MRSRFVPSMRIVSSVTVGLVAVGFVVLADRSGARARNSDNRWDEECWFEGCDHEEREEMFDAGSFSGEASAWSISNTKTRFQATWEVTEIGSPGNTANVAWGYCKLMVDEFSSFLGKTDPNIPRISNDCNARWGSGGGRPH